MNQYKVYFSNNETAIINADDYEIKLNENEGQRRIVFTMGDRIIAFFNLSIIAGVELLW